MLENLKRLSESLQKGLPEYTLEGIDRIYWDKEIAIERMLCFYFGAWEEFHERQMYRAYGMDVPPLDERVKEWKTKKLDPFTTAAGILVTYILADRVPVPPETRKEIDHHFGYILKDLPPKEEYVAKHFTEQSTLLNLSANSRHITMYQHKMPDRTLSTLCAYTRINPRMEFIAANLTDQTFAGDEIFFEDANFRAADMRGCTFEETSSIKRALLEGADLRGAKGLTNEILAHCYIDERTKLPGNVDRKIINALHDLLKMPPAPPFTELEEKYMPKKKEPKAKKLSAMQQKFDVARDTNAGNKNTAPAPAPDDEHAKAMQKYRALRGWQV